MGLHCDACLDDVDRTECYGDMVFRAGMPTPEQTMVLGNAIIEGKASAKDMVTREDIIFCARCLAQSGLIERVSDFIKWHQNQRDAVNPDGTSALTLEELNALGLKL